MRLLPPSLAMFLLACNGSPTEPLEPAEAPSDQPVVVPDAPPVDGPSIVLITMDTTRADRLGAYGYPGAKTPVIDRMASEGVRFERAYAVVPLTTPAHASMFTGLYPTRHGIHTNGDAVLPDSAVCIAERMQDAGYHTAASVSAFVTTRIWNLDQGFDSYFDDVASRTKQANKWGRERPANAVVDDLIGWLEEDREGAFFLWAHFYDPHAPYAPRPPFDRNKQMEPYDQEIAFMDLQMARLEEAVSKAAGEAGSHWILVADHGEALYTEHGEHTHGMFIFDPTMRIPFIVKPAKPLAAPVVVTEDTVSNVDVGPTALGLLGLPPLDDVDGVDLSPFTRGERSVRAPVYMEADTVRQRFGFATEVAAAHGPLKLIDTPSPLLFDVEADPHESKNLLDAQPDDVSRLRAAIEAEHAKAVAAAGEAPSPEVLEQLAALGYVGNDFDHNDDDGPRLDAKDNMALIRKLEEARGLSSSPKKADLQASVALFEDLLSTHPDLAEARMSLGRALMRLGQPVKAERVYRAAIEVEPNSTILRTNLGSCLASQGKFDDAVAELEAVLAQVPGDDGARIALLRMLTDAKQEDKALRLAEEWLVESPDHRGYQAHAGILLLRKQRPEEAHKMLQASLEDAVPRQYVRRDLGRIALLRGDQAATIDHYQRELQYFPANSTVREQLAGLLMAAKDWQGAADQFEALIKMDGSLPGYHLGWAQAVFNLGDYAAAKVHLAPALATSPDDPEIVLLHANIVGKLEGSEAGAKIFERAKDLKRAQMEEQKAALEAEAKTAEDGEAAKP